MLIPIKEQIIEFIIINNWWISLVLAVFVGILVNLVTPSIQESIREWRLNRTLTTSQQKLKQLERQLKLITAYHKDTEKFFVATIYIIFRVLLNLGLASAAHSFSFIVSFGFLFAIPAILETAKHLKAIENLLDYEEFKGLTELEIKKLKQEIGITDP